MRRIAHRIAPALAIAATALMLQGCAAGLGLTMLGIGGGTAASAGVNHTLGGIAYKTFTAPSDDVHAATLVALETMAMPISSDTRPETDDQSNLRLVQASAADRVIDIEIEEVTPLTTRLRVVASKDILFKDSATATEIIMQTAMALDQLQTIKTRKTANKANKTNVRARRSK